MPLLSMLNNGNMQGFFLKNGCLFISVFEQNFLIDEFLKIPFSLLLKCSLFFLIVASQIFFFIFREILFQIIFFEADMKLHR